MKDKNQYQALLRGKVASAVLQARMAAGFTHQGVKGTVLEILLSQLFRPLLPSDIGVGTGQIIECHSGKMSPQIDIVIYNKSIPPPILIDGNTGLFPIESVLYTIEVKTTLTSSGLSAAHECAKDLCENFGYLPDRMVKPGTENKTDNLRSVVFALNTDLSENGMTEAERYKKIYKDDKRYIRAICVAGIEYSYEEGDYWITIRKTEQFDEMLSFIAGVTNTYKDVSNNRGYPLLGHYVVPENISLTRTLSIHLPELTIKCDTCGNEKKIIPNFDATNDITITDGTISDNEACECGGTLKSEKGNYIIKKGRLREIVPTPLKLE